MALASAMVDIVGNVYVAVATELLSMPLFTPIALTVVVVLIAIGEE